MENHGYKMIKIMEGENYYDLFFVKKKHYCNDCAVL